MAQTSTIETSNLRPLPLPGRGDAAPLDVTVRGTRETAAGAQAARGITANSRQAENFVTVNYKAAITLPQPAANNTRGEPTPFRVNTGALSDDIGRFLLSANEVENAPAANNNEGAARRSGVAAYRDVAAVFPRTQSSLFSIAT